jgi:ADP-L-glycero-D-manno-heptose 6-epimerase
LIVVTGGAGFIGSNLVRALNQRGRADVWVVDDFADGRKFANLVDCELADVTDKDEFLARVVEGRLGDRVEAVFHQGACADTLEWDGRYVLRVNYEYSKALLEWCAARRVPFVYASSASVYGMGPTFREEPACERPLNLYAWSKLLFDRWVRRRLPELASPVVGLRYFNVYGPREQHKGEMASVACKLHGQLLQSGRVRLFRSSDGYADGEQRRDFVCVDDVVAVNLWMLDHPGVSGIFNVGTGRAQTFNDVARAVIAYHGRGQIEYVPFPPELAGRYQSFTEADLSALRKAGYRAPFASVEEGVPRYLAWLEAQGISSSATTGA